MQRKRLRPGDYRVDIMVFEHACKQGEFRAQVLFCRTLIDDCDTSQLPTRKLGLEFIAKHLDECVFEISRIDAASNEILDFIAAGLLGAGDLLQE